MQFAQTVASVGGLMKSMISGMAKPFRPTKMALNGPGNSFRAFVHRPALPCNIATSLARAPRCSTVWDQCAVVACPQYWWYERRVLSDTASGCALVLLVLVVACLLAHLDLGGDELGIVLDVVDHVVGEHGHA